MSKYQIQQKQEDETMGDIYPVTKADYVETTNGSGQSVQTVLDAMSTTLSTLSTGLNDVKSDVENGVVSNVTVSGSGSSGRVNVTKGGATTALTVPYATKAGSLSNTSAIGSSSIPVYINASGAPTSTGYNLSTMTTNITKAQTTADEAKVIAEGRSAAKSYDTYSAMVTAVNAMASTDMKVGDNIYIATLDVPDIWVSGVNTTKTTYTYSSDSALAGTLKSSAGATVGYYILKALETNKVDLTNYVTKTYTGTIAASISGNAATSTKASYDELGNKIQDTYAAKTSVVGGVNYTEGTNTVSVLDGNGLPINSFTPANDKVKSSVINSKDEYVVLLAPLNAATMDSTDYAYKYASLFVNSSRQLAGSFKGSLTGNASTATKLATARNLAVTVQSGTNAAGNTISNTGAGQAFDGTANKTMTVALGNSGIAAGTYSAVQVNEKGIAVAGGQMLQIGQTTSETASASLAVGGLFFKKLD